MNTKAAMAQWTLSVLLFAVSNNSVAVDITSIKVVHRTVDAYVWLSLTQLAGLAGKP